MGGDGGPTTEAAEGEGLTPMPKDRGASRAIAPGIYRDQIGYRAVVAVGSGPTRVQREHRFPKDATLRQMKAWQGDTRSELRKTRPRANAGTLQHDVKRYLKVVASMPSLDTRGYELAAWVAECGERKTLELTIDELGRVHRAWAKVVSPITCNHRRNALSQLFQTLYPEHADVAARLPYLQPPHPTPRGIADADIVDILTALLPSKTRARLYVMATTGLPPARIMRMTEADIDLEQRTMRLEGRRKGAGTRGRAYLLSADAVAAWRAFIAADAWGTFSSAGMWVTFQRGVTAVNAARVAKRLPPLPPIRPYDLRHAFGRRVYETTRDLRATADLLDCSLETAMRYTASAAGTVMAATVAGLNASAVRLAPETGTPTILPKKGRRTALPKPARRVRFP